MSVSQVGTLATFTSGQTISSSSVNSNFSALKTAFNNLVASLNTINVDTISEVTADGGVTVDSVLLKDGAVTATGGPSSFDDISCVDLTISGVASFGPSAITGGGTFGAGAYTFPSTLAVGGALTVSSGGADITGTTDLDVLNTSGKITASGDLEMDTGTKIVLPFTQLVTNAAASWGGFFTMFGGSVTTTGGTTSITRPASGTDGAGFFILADDQGHAFLFAINGSNSIVSYSNLGGVGVYYTISGPPASTQVEVTCGGTTIDIDHGSSVVAATYTIFQIGVVP